MNIGWLKILSKIPVLVPACEVVAIFVYLSYNIPLVEFKIIIVHIVTHTSFIDSSLILYWYEFLFLHMVVWIILGNRD